MNREVFDIWYSEFHSPKGDVKFSLKVDEVLWSEQSPFQKIVFMKNNTFGTFFTLDGFVMITEKDEFIYHDMICHPAMAVNPKIKRVLIIGGGDGGTAREMAKYPRVEQIDLVEIDERVVRLCQRFIPQTARVLGEDGRINMFFEDGLNFVKNAPAESYDLILVDSTDPIGHREGLFTLDFYENCRRLLNSEGILVNQHESAFYSGDIQEMQRPMKSLIKFSLLPGCMGLMFPLMLRGIGISALPQKLHPLKQHKAKEWEALGIKTRYYNKDIHKAAFALPNYVQDILKGE